MTDAATLLALAGRVGKLTGPCRETDARIHVYLEGWQFLIYEKQRGGDACRVSNNGNEFYEALVNVSHYTGSLDAAMTLAMDWDSIRFEKTRDTFGCFVNGLDTNAATPVLALTSALLRLRARAAQAPSVAAGERTSP